MITSDDTFLIVIGVFLVFTGLLALFVFGWWFAKKERGLSPYTGQPLRFGTDLHWFSKERVLKFLFERSDYYNQLINFEKAAYCRETGRIFTHCVTWYGAIKVDWGFIQKRVQGNFVSWGSLEPDQQQIIREQHGSLENFQTEFSSTRPAPNQVEEPFIYRRPGPLYVDINTGILVGWQCVPETELEVLIVQRPLER